MTTLVQGTAVVWLPVTDIDRSLGFYRDTLGLTEKQSDGDWAQLDANGVGIGLNAAESPSGDGGAVIAFQPEGGLDAAVDELRDAGVEIAGDVTEHPWGRVRHRQGSRRQRRAALRAAGLVHAAEEAQLLRRRAVGAVDERLQVGRLVAVEGLRLG